VLHVGGDRGYCHACLLAGRPVLGVLLSDALHAGLWRRRATGWERHQRVPDADEMVSTDPSGCPLKVLSASKGYKVRIRATETSRLSAGETGNLYAQYRSNENIYAQIIDDTTARTLVSCSTLDRTIKVQIPNGRTCDASRIMGEKLAELSLKKNITKIVFDRGPYLYHGRVKALADGARAGGLQF
jgi:large subunit ribosomal protein L18